MGLESLCRFIIQNEVTEDNAKFIQKELRTIEADAWMKGYSRCLSDRKKHALIKQRRRKGVINRYLDYLSDLTHTPQKA